MTLSAQLVNIMLEMLMAMDSKFKSNLTHKMEYLYEISDVNKP